MLTAPLRDQIRAVATNHGVDAALLEAQVLVESSGQPDAFRFEPAFYRTYIRGNPAARAARFGPLAACSYGLLQVMLETAYERGFQGLPHQLFVPAIGLDWGVRHLVHCLAWAKGDVPRALACYNGGPRGNAAAPLRNQGYVDRVLRTRDAVEA